MSEEEEVEITEAAGEPVVEAEPEVVSTPKNVFGLATWLQRFAAALVDIGLLFTIFVCGVYTNEKSVFFGSALILVSAGLTFWNLWRQGESGQTIGKRLLGIRLVSETNAGCVGGWYSIGRSLVHIVDFPFYIGFLFPMWDQKRQTFADKIMKTVVVVLDD